MFKLKSCKDIHRHQLHALRQTLILKNSFKDKQKHILRDDHVLFLILFKRTLGSHWRLDVSTRDAQLLHKAPNLRVCERKLCIVFAQNPKMVLIRCARAVWQLVLARVPDGVIVVVRLYDMRPGQGPLPSSRGLNEVHHRPCSLFHMCRKINALTPSEAMTIPQSDRHLSS